MGRTSRASLAESAALDGGRIEGGFQRRPVPFPKSNDGTTWHATWPGVQKCKNVLVFFVIIGL